MSKICRSRIRDEDELAPFSRLAMAGKLPQASDRVPAIGRTAKLRAIIGASAKQHDWRCRCWPESVSESLAAEPVPLPLKSKVRLPKMVADNVPVRAANYSMLLNCPMRGN